MRGACLGVIVAIAAVIAAIAVTGEAQALRSKERAIGGEWRKTSSRQADDDDPCKGMCQGDRNCVIAKNGRPFCIDCTALVRELNSESNYEKCCRYSEEKMRCITMTKMSELGVCMRSEDLFARVFSDSSSVTPATVRRRSGRACNRPWDFLDNKLACKVRTSRRGVSRCVDGEGVKEPCYSITQVGEDIRGESAQDFSGWSVAMSADGSRIAVGAPGSGRNQDGPGYVRVYDFKKSEEEWIQLGQDMVGESERDASGRSVAMSADGTRVAIGAVLNTGNGSGSGHVRVYDLQEDDVWVQVGEDIDGEEPGDQSGTSVAMSENGARVAIGAIANDGNGSFSGHVRVYEWQADEGWIQMGQDIDGEGRLDQSGISVSMSASGSRVAIGAKFNNGNGPDSGHVRVFELTELEELEDGEAWVQLGEDIDGESQQDLLSVTSLSADGNRVAIGATGNDENGISAGHVRVYELDENVGWMQVGQDIDGKSAGDAFGFSVAISASGSRLVVGAPGNDASGRSAGQIRIYELREDEEWVQIGTNVDGVKRLDEMGGAVAISADGNRAAGGSTMNSDGGNNSGHVRVFDIVKGCR